jgi:phosphohistidine phosphatase SixA
MFSLFLISCGNTFYIVRHAEKVTAKPGEKMMDNNPPLTEDGQRRALALKQLLSGKNVKHFYSTNTIRTISTITPLKEQFLNTTIQIYSSKPDSMDAFIQLLRSIKKGNVLIAGHSNTVDDIANKLCGKTEISADLKDSEYDNLFEVKRKGNKFTFKRTKYGAPSE